MKKLALVLGLLFIGTFTSAKKAEAGIILGATVSPTSVALVAGGVFVGGGVASFLLDPDKYQRQHQVGDVPEITHYQLLGGLLILLSNSEGEVNFKGRFDTIPSYVFDEIYSYARTKAESLDYVNEGVKEVVMTENEASELLEAAHGVASLNDIIELKTVLTSGIAL